MGYWTPAAIEQEAQEFYVQYGRLTSQFLNSHKRSDLSNQIIHSYPNGFKGLKEKLGIKDPIPQNITISPEDANEQLRRLLEG